MSRLCHLAVHEPRYGHSAKCTADASRRTAHKTNTFVRPMAGPSIGNLIAFGHYIFQCHLKVRRNRHLSFMAFLMEVSPRQVSGIGVMDYTVGLKQPIHNLRVAAVVELAKEAPNDYLMQSLTGAMMASQWRRGG